MSCSMTRDVTKGSIPQGYARHRGCEPTPTSRGHQAASGARLYAAASCANLSSVADSGVFSA